MKLTKATRNMLVLTASLAVLCMTFVSMASAAAKRTPVREVAILPIINEDDEDYTAYTRDALREYFLDQGATLCDEAEIDKCIEINKPEKRRLTMAEKVDIVRGYFPNADLFVVVTIEEVERVSKKLGIEKRNKVTLTGELWNRTGESAVFSAEKSADNKEKSIAGLKTKEGRTEHSRQLAITECIGKLFDDILQTYKLGRD